MYKARYNQKDDNIQARKHAYIKSYHKCMKSELSKYVQI